ncbi:hypothetical protein GCM10027443_05220 [Pontibacter brevis]
MPQGTVIAVKPVGFVSDPEVMNASITETTNYSFRSPEEPNPVANLVYIKVYEDERKRFLPRKFRTVVWYEDTAGVLKEGDFVEFNIDNTKTKPMKGAVGVKKLNKKIVPVPVDLLTVVAVFASVLLLAAVTIDSRR